MPTVCSSPFDNESPDDGNWNDSPDLTLSPPYGINRCSASKASACAAMRELAEMLRMRDHAMGTDRRGTDRSLSGTAGPEEALSIASFRRLSSSVSGERRPRIRLRATGTRRHRRTTSTLCTATEQRGKRAAIQPGWRRSGSLSDTRSHDGFTTCCSSPIGHDPANESAYRTARIKPPADINAAPAATA